MSMTPDDPPPTPPPTTSTPSSSSAMDYVSPGATPPPERKRLVQGIVLGVIVAIVLLVATPLICSAIDAKLNPGELAGLGGLFLGAMLGAGLLLLATLLAFTLPARHRSPLLRGAGRGMLLMVGVAALAAGVCSVAM